MNVQSAPPITKREGQAIQAFLDRVRCEFPTLNCIAILFGSKARGDSRADSDIDILLITSEESWALRNAISNLAADVSLEYDVLLSPRLIGQERWERMKQRRFSLYRVIASEGIPLAFPAGRAAVHE